MFLNSFICVQSLLLAEKWAAMNNIPFPKIDVACYAAEDVKECYVFHDENRKKTPIVIHFVLGNITYRKYSEPGKS